MKRISTEFPVHILWQLGKKTIIYIKIRIRILDLQIFLPNQIIHIKKLRPSSRKPKEDLNCAISSTHIAVRNSEQLDDLLGSELGNSQIISLTLHLGQLPL